MRNKNRKNVVFFGFSPNGFFCPFVFIDFFDFDRDTICFYDSNNKEKNKIQKKKQQKTRVSEQ